ncbi:cache domain-containing protein [Tianweitania sediminis]|uniref:cache domain-containing protein n=1 Tax=Tianweitania sediminis TaxID=1502156 RepID=UPI003158794B
MALALALAASVSWYLVSDRGSQFRRDALAEAVTVRARGLQVDFARALHQEWRHARTIAEDIVGRGPEAVRSSLDLVVGDSSRVSWAGIAALDGTVTMASGRLLEGQDVSQRPWFQRGLEGDFAGDVHEAVLLAKLLPSQSGEPRRFLDLATPIRNQDGAVSGVLGLHLDQAWASRHLRDSAQAMGLDVFLIDRSGTVVIGTKDEIETLDLPSTRAAMAGVAFTSLETWTDGQEYFTTVIPQVSYEDLPAFGWSMVARIDNNAVSVTTPMSSLVIIPAAFVVGLLLMTLLFVRLFADPFRNLANTAAAVMKGQDVYPYESRSTAEAQTLSAALALLQGRSKR